MSETIDKTIAREVFDKAARSDIATSNHNSQGRTVGIVDITVGDAEYTVVVPENSRAHIAFEEREGTPYFRHHNAFPEQDAALRARWAKTGIRR